MNGGVLCCRGKRRQSMTEREIRTGMGGREQAIGPKIEEEDRQTGTQA